MSQIKQVKKGRDRCPFYKGGRLLGVSVKEESLNSKETIMVQGSSFHSINICMHEIVLCSASHAITRQIF